MSPSTTIYGFKGRSYIVRPLGERLLKLDILIPRQEIQRGAVARMKYMIRIIWYDTCATMEPLNCADLFQIRVRFQIQISLVGTFLQFDFGSRIKSDADDFAKRVSCSFMR